MRFNVNFNTLLENQDVLSSEASPAEHLFWYTLSVQSWVSNQKRSVHITGGVTLLDIKQWASLIEYYYAEEVPNTTDMMMTTVLVTVVMYDRAVVGLTY